MLEGKGAFKDAKRQLEDEAAEEFYQKFKSKKKRKPRQYEPRHKRWARHNAEVLYNRGVKRKERGY